MSSQTSQKQQTPAVTPIKEMRGHTGNVRGVVRLPGGRRIMTCSLDGSLRVWDLESGTQIGEGWQDDEAKQAGVWDIALSPNGKTVVTGSTDRKVKLWDVETGKVIQRWMGHTKGVTSVCWSAGGDRILSGSTDGTARVWNAKTGETILEIKTGHKSVWAVKYSPDDTQITTGGNDEDAAKIWDAKTGELIKTLKYNQIVWSLAWTSDGKKLITGSYASIRIFDTATWEQIATLDGSWVNAISLSPNNRLLASASWDKTARIWNLDTNLPVGPPLQHKDEVYTTAFSANGRVLVTGSKDKNAYAWDVNAILKQAGLEDLLQPPSDVPARKSLKGSGATRLPPIQARRIPPGFFDGVQNSSQSSTAHATHTRSSTNNPIRAFAPSSADLHALLNRISSFFHHSRSDTDAATELQQRPARSIFSRGPRVVEVAAVQDRKPLAVAPQQVRRTHATGTTAPGATPTPIPWWAHVVLFLCCASPRQPTQTQQQQQQQSQAHGQVQTQEFSSQPAAPSTSSPVISTTPPNAATVRSQPPPLRARIVLFLCCASPAHADGH